MFELKIPLEKYCRTASAQYKDKNNTLFCSSIASIEVIHWKGIQWVCDCVNRSVSIILIWVENQLCHIKEIIWKSSNICVDHLITYWYLRVHNIIIHILSFTIYLVTNLSIFSEYIPNKSFTFSIGLILKF